MTVGPYYFNATAGKGPLQSGLPVAITEAAFSSCCCGIEACGPYYHIVGPDMSWMVYSRSKSDYDWYTEASEDYRSFNGRSITAEEFEIYKTSEQIVCAEYTDGGRTMGWAEKDVIQMSHRTSPNRLRVVFDGKGTTEGSVFNTTGYVEVAQALIKSVATDNYPPYCSGSAVISADEKRVDFTVSLDPVEVSPGVWEFMWFGFDLTWEWET